MAELTQIEAVLKEKTRNQIMTEVEMLLDDIADWAAPVVKQITGRPNLSQRQVQAWLRVFMDTYRQGGTLPHKPLETLKSSRVSRAIRDLLAQTEDLVTVRGRIVQGENQ